jgi:NADH:ubiquinone oxidoreductase subunit F (NADH-binding)
MNERGERVLTGTEPVSCLADCLATGSAEALTIAGNRSADVVLDEVRRVDRRGRGSAGEPGAGEPGTVKARYIVRKNDSLLQALDEKRAVDVLGAVPIRFVFGSDAHLRGEENATIKVVEGGRPPLPRILPPCQNSPAAF